MEYSVDDILATISKHTGIPTPGIIKCKMRDCSTARAIACHIIKNECPSLTNNLAYILGVTRKQLFMSAYNMQEKSKNDNELFLLENKIRCELGLKLIEKEIPYSMQIFGFKWTEKENEDMKRAMDESVAYMNKLCEVGQPPIEKGMVFRPRRDNIKVNQI